MEAEEIFNEYYSNHFYPDSFWDGSKTQKAHYEAILRYCIDKVEENLNQLDKRDERQDKNTRRDKG